MRTNTIRRRILLASVAGLGVAGSGLAGCGGRPESASAGRTIAHKYGSTVVSGTPSRIVTVGLTEQDYVLALGVAPVGVREWFGNQPGALWPWARRILGSRTLPRVLPVATLKYEEIAGLKPDLILGVNSGLTSAEYAKLSQLAPTVAQPKEYADFGVPWQVMTRTVGDALGRRKKADTLVSGLEARFRQIRASHPELAGKTGLLSTSIQGGVWVYAEGPAPAFLTQLGLKMPAATSELFVDKNRKPVQLSLERLDVLESDVLLMGAYGGGNPPVRDRPLYRRLRAYREGRDLVMPELSRLNGALSFGSILSLPIALDEFILRLPALIDGNPATRPTAVA